MSKKKKNKRRSGEISISLGSFSTGVLVGVFISPYVRKSLTTLQPRMHELLDDLTGKAENWSEKASDLISRAKDVIKREKGDDNSL